MNDGDTLSQLKLYQDGVLLSNAIDFHNDADPVLNTTTSSGGGTITADIRIGTFNVNDSADFNGSMAEISIWNKALSDGQVADYMTQSLTGGEDGLFGYWPADEGTGTTLIDETGTNNGTITGGTWDTAVTANIEGNSVSIVENGSAQGVMTAEDVNGTASYSVKAVASNGLVVIDAVSGDWSYRPNVGFTGSDTFTLRANGATSGTDDEAITVTVTERGVAPGGYDNPSAMVFDGTNDYVKVSHSDSQNLTSWTMEAWFQTTDHASTNFTGSGRILFKAQGSGGNGYSLFVHSNKAAMFTNGLNTPTVTGTSTVNDGQWHHMAGTYDGATRTLKIYVDGVLEATTVATSGTPVIDPNDLLIGAGDDTSGPGISQFFDGMIDDVRLWSDVRTAEEIQDNMSTPIEPSNETNLAGYWRLDEKSGTAVEDISGNNNNGVVKNGPVFTDETSPVGRDDSVTLDGVNDYMSAAIGTGTFSNAYTMEGWIYVDQSDISSSVLVPFELFQSTSFVENAVQIVNGKLDMWVQGFTNGTTTTIRSSTDVPTGQWVHIAGTLDGSTAKLYLNGVEVQSVSGITGQANFTNVAQTFHLGRNDGATDHVDGNFDDVRLWNTARTAEQIRENMDTGVSSTTSGLVANWEFDEGAGTVAYDRTSNNFDGTLQLGAQFTSETMPPNGARHTLSFDGTDDGITVANASALNFGASSSFSVEAWVKTTDTGAFQRVLIKPAGGTQENAGQQSYSLVVNSGKAHIRFDQSGGGGHQAEGTTAVNDGEWHHIAGVFDNTGNTLSVYVDGVLDGSTASITAEPNQDTLDLEIGMRSNQSSQFFDGEISDVRLWSDARTVDEINQNMNSTLSGTEANLAGNWMLNEGAGTVISDKTTNGNDGTLHQNSLEVPSGGSVDLNGTTDYVDLPDATLDGLSTGTIEAWVFLDANTSETITAKQHDGTNTTAVFSVGDSFGATTGKLTFRPANGAVAQGSSTISTGVWTHVAVTFNSSEAKFYVNGSLDGTVSGNFSIPALGAATHTTLGSILVGGGPAVHADSDLDGKMSDVRIWNDVRTDSEISSNYQTTLNGNEAGLNAYYKMNDGTGTNANDSTSNNLDGTLSGGASFATEGIAAHSNPDWTDASETPVDDNHALKFGNDGDSVTIDSMNLSNTSFSWEFWAKRETESDIDLVLTQNDGASGNAHFFHAGWTSADTFRYSFNQSSGNFRIDYNDTSDLGEWHHWAGTFDTATNAAVLFKDGEQVANKTFDGDLLVAGGTDLVIGRTASSSGHHMSGEVDEVRIWNDVRTAEEIRANFDRELNGSETGLEAYYNFSETAGTSTNDASTNSHTGTISGATYTNLEHISITGGSIYKGMVLGADANGDNLSYELLEGPDNHNGTFVLEGNQFTYINDGDKGEDSFIVNVIDEDGNQTSETILFDVV